MSGNATRRPSEPPISRSRRLWAAARLPVLLFASIGGAILAIVALPVLVIALGFWAADGAWEFEGTGMRHWLFVRGTRLERLGAIGAVEGPIRYSISLQEGTFPGWSVASYHTRAAPSAVAEAYAQLCRDEGLKITSLLVPEAPDQQAELTCEIVRYLDIEVAAKRAPGAALTHVFVKVWGDQ